MRLIVIVAAVTLALISIPVSLVSIPTAVAADTVTTRLYCDINVECVF